MNQQVATQQQNTAPKPFEIMANRLQVNPEEIERLMVSTLMKAKGRNEQVTHDEVVAFMAVANEYKLNPLTKEIYGFNNRGSIQPIVSVDGWLRIINSNPNFDGMEFDDALDDNGGLTAVRCRIYRKDRNRPTEVTEYMAECKGDSQPWKKWPARMLRHKATIQCARYAFGLSGIVDPDEADRIKASIEAENERSHAPQPVLQAAQGKPEYPWDRFDKNFPKWEKAIRSGAQTADEIIATIESGFELVGDQHDAIWNVQHEVRGQHETA